jgi:hypothetical protein
MNLKKMFQMIVAYMKYITKEGWSELKKCFTAGLFKEPVTSEKETGINGAAAVDLAKQLLEA